VTRAEHTAIVCQTHKLKFEDLRGWCKKRPIVAARRELWHRLLVVQWAEQVLAGIEPKVASLPGAGGYLRKDPTTVLYAVRRFSAEHYGTGPKAKLADIRSAYLNSLQAMEIAA
jgi:chromosomal replication initiation ATPase DnaA